MRLILHADLRGIEKVVFEHSSGGEQEEAHKLFDMLRPAIEKFGEAVKTAAKNLCASAEEWPFEKESVLGK